MTISGARIASGAAPVQKTSQQTSQLLPTLFRNLDEERRLSVLHIGPTSSDTINFFSGFRCRLQVFDLFAELPLPDIEETERGLEPYLQELLQFPADTRFDLCLFWDVFDYLDEDALPAFLSVLRPCLAASTLAHGFTVHNPRTPANDVLYAIKGIDQLSLRSRPTPLPGYAPHNQNKLKQLLHCFRTERSVLLPDRRLELLLRAKLD
ncbi:MAG: hypothetical protein Hals2KO_20220 [Halioglobus sp.]